MTYEPGVTVITATGGRPEAFGLCQQYIERQTYSGLIQHIIVDDFDPPHRSTKDPEMIAQCEIFPRPAWQPGQNTLARNLLAAIPHVRYDKVVFAEDDDRLPEHFLETLVEGLSDQAICGDYSSLYYHVRARRYRRMVGGSHCSLGQTIIRAEFLPILRQVCEEGPDHIDVRLWMRAPNPRRWAIHGFVSMKGLPGRPGIGIGHHPERNPDLWKPDPDMSVLRSWIGSDCEFYERFSR